MHIPSSHVFDVLEEKGVDSIHHVNSVVTAAQFIRAKSLMSRGTVHRKGIKQTPQDSDKTDRRMSLWFDVFADSVDIHARASRLNAYGPVMFEFDPRVIRKGTTGRIWVTKLNPTKWEDKTEGQRWFQDKEDLEENFVRGRFDQMIVFRHCGGELPFRSALKRIVLDDPRLQNAQGVDLYSLGYGALRLALSDAGIDVPIERRECRPQCTCRAQYAGNLDRTYSMFDPMA